MARIVRTQNVHYDTVSMLGIQGAGTAKFETSGAPARKTRTISAVFTGNIRVTRLANGSGYNVLLLDAARNADRKRVHFKGDALVALGGTNVTMDQYWSVLDAHERVFGITR